jgi:hypothetical protein
MPEPVSTTTALLNWAKSPQGISTLTTLGSKLFGGFGKSKRKIPTYSQSSEEKAYMDELLRRSQYGIYTPGMQKEMLSQTSSVASQQADIGKQSVLGQITRQGLENSAVAPEQTAAIEVARQRKIAETARRISLENQLSKVKAADMLGEHGIRMSKNKYMDALAKYRQKGNFWDDMMSAAGDTVSVYLAGMGNTKDS